MLYYHAGLVKVNQVPARLLAASLVRRRRNMSSFAKARTVPGGVRGADLVAWSGFTLIELLILVGVLTIVAAIAIPNLIEAKEKSAALRAVGLNHAPRSDDASVLIYYEIPGGRIYRRDGYAGLVFVPSATATPERGE